MEIYLIRHTTPAIAKGIIYGKRFEVGLANSSIIEAERIKEQLSFSIDTVYCSPATRCTLLADHLFPDNYYKDERLCEIDFGEWEGKAWNDIPQDELNEWMNDYENIAPPGGESMNEMKERVINFVNEIVHNNQHKIIVITHAGVIRLMLSHFYKKPMSELFAEKIDFGEVIKINPPVLPTGSLLDIAE